MASVAISTLLTDVLPYVGGCSDIQAEAALKDSAVLFCQRTQVWRYSSGDETIQATDLPYKIQPPGGAFVTDVLEVWVDDRVVRPASHEALARYGVQWRELEGPPTHYTFDGAEELTLYPLPEGSVRLRVDAALAPSNFSLPLHIVREHKRALVDGALSTLMSMPGQPWYNPSNAVFYANRAGAAMSAARIKVSKSGTSTDLSISMQHHW